MKTITTQVLIIGGGAAGLNAALNLNTRDVFLIEKMGSNSLLSPWNIMIKPKEELRESIIKTGNKLNDLNLLNSFLEGYDDVIKDLKKIGIKFRKSNLGVIPNYTLPGLESRMIFLKKLKYKKTNILKGEAKKFLIDNGKIKGIEVLLSNSKKIKIFFNYLILATGGLGGFFPYRTGSEDSDGSILSLCYEAGFQIRDIEFFMFHPFLITDKRLPRMLISGDILTKMEYENEKGENFLSKEITEALRNNQHHYFFPQMIREFYLQSLNNKIFGRLICSNNWFNAFKKENEFGFIFKKFTKNKLKKIELHPAFHFSIGGLSINNNACTSKEDIYAAGEITGGLHGSNRIGGLAIAEALIFSKKAALDINKKMEKNKKEILIPNKINKIGKLGLSKTIKRKIWKSLGPIKNQEKLKNFKKFLLSKKNLTSQEKFLIRIIQVCLLRKESIGSFYRSDLKQAQKASSSFIINNKIIFK